MFVLQTAISKNINDLECKKEEWEYYVASIIQINVCTKYIIVIRHLHHPTI